MCFDSKFVANSFNNFFLNVANTLVEKLEKRVFDENGIKSFYEKKGVTNDVFNIKPVSERDVYKLLSSLDVSKATGCDDIPSRFLKDAATVIVCPLTHVFNLSIKDADVPTEFKIARVVPLYKKGNKSVEGNYRPVSILPVVSKILERLVYNQVYKYLNDCNLLYEYQSGFRTGFSTDTALTYLGDKIRNNMDKGLYTGMVLIDLQKAFDTVDHHILDKKMKAVGFCQNSVKWFNSYLTDRKQFVAVNGCHSEYGNISCGVPQGSILGPLLFVLYVNDMISAVDCELCMYADDAALIVSGKSVDVIEKRLSKELNGLSYWLEQNKLSLHLGKTESILFGSSKKLCNKSEMKITCKQTDINSKAIVKYLGVDIDQNMSGDTIGNENVKKINNKLKFLYRKASFLNLRERTMLCSAMLQSHFDYACNFWYRGLCSYIKKRLQTAQNKIIRYILDYSSRSHIGYSDHCKVNMLNVEQRVNYLTLNHMYNIVNGSSPVYLNSMNEVSHCHNTRGGSKFNIPQVGTQGKRTFNYNGAKLWNDLPASIKIINEKITFKSKVKEFLLSNMKEEDFCDFLY